ncbi:hypothetical protein GCM10020219_046600 [Nonomuraea dietziae]
MARASDVAAMIDFAGQIHVADPVYDYIVALVASTRTNPQPAPGRQPARQPRAAAPPAGSGQPPTGRHYVVPEDVKALAVPVIAHRLILTPEAELRQRTAADVLGEVMAGMPVPQAA